MGASARPVVWYPGQSRPKHPDFPVADPRDNSDGETVEALCVRAAAGDLDAAERLLWMHHKRLLVHAVRKVGVDWQGKIEPEDILQDAYIDVLRGIGAFEARDSESFYRWVSRIVDHKFIDHVRVLRRAKRDTAREISVDGRAALLDRLTDGGSTPSRIIRRADAEAAMLACIAGLPDEQRDILTRRYFRNEPYARIAESLGKSEDAVRRACGRAVDRVRERLGRASWYLSRGS